MQRALSAVLLLALAPRTAGHGWLAEPPARNAKGEERNGYCPQCGNGGSVCGDGGQWPASSNYLDGKGAGPQRTFTAGEVVEFTIKITAHHKGHMELHVCDETIGPQTQSPEGAQGCLNKWILQRVPPEEAHNDCKVNDARDSCQPLDTAYPERWYLSPGTGTKKMKFRIPQGLKCSSCTLQWRWWTANSCIPAAGYGCYFSRFQAAGWDKQAWCGSFCGSDSCSSLLETNTSRVQAHETLGCGEEFRNCADIAVLSSGGAPAPVTPQPAPAPAPTNPTKAPEQEPEPEPEAEEPEPEPEPEQEPATPAPSPQGCKAKPGNNGGATDAYCSKCATGYKWWPCNDQRLCEGAACIMSLAQGAVHKKASRENRGFLATALIQAQTALGRVMGMLDAEEEL